MIRYLWILPLLISLLQILLPTLHTVASSENNSTESKYEHKLNQTKCSFGTFRNGTGQCQRHATCKTINKVDIERPLLNGNVKRSYIGMYAGVKVVYSVPSNELVKEDFHHGVKMIRQLQDSKQVIRLVGYCEDVNNLQLMTVYSEHGSVDNLNEIYRKLNLSEADEWRWRIQHAIDYLYFIDFLHNSPIGTRVMCDGNDLEKLLSQFLIQDDLRLVANDLDALPEVSSSKKIKCGHRQLHGTFVAPEQLWPWPDEPFDDSRMPGYGEQIDVWRVPDVLAYLLGSRRGAMQVRIHCMDLFKRCKYLDPLARPNSYELVVEFYRVLKYLNDKQEEELAKEANKTVADDGKKKDDTNTTTVGNDDKKKDDVKSEVNVENKNQDKMKAMTDTVVKDDEKNKDDAKKKVDDNKKPDVNKSTSGDVIKKNNDALKKKKNDISKKRNDRKMKQKETKNEQLEEGEEEITINIRIKGKVRKKKPTPKSDL